MKTIYFLGIGGIGMSALAFYFLKQGVEVYGYDLTPSPITDELQNAGAKIHFEEDINSIPKKIDFVVYTPAIPKEHSEYQYFIKNKTLIYKRSEVLGELTKNKACIAIAGTHGKTTTTAIVSHLLHPEHSILAFIGGISKNLNSNYILNVEYETVVVEADEFDRSFLTLHPSTAIISSMDADHLDIYGAKSNLTDAFQDFANLVEKQGNIVVNEAIAAQIQHPHKITFGLSPDCDYFVSNVVLSPLQTQFTFHHHNYKKENCILGVGGNYNLINALAAIVAVCEEYKNHENKPDLDSLLKKLANFSGVKRRFDYKVFRDDFIFIDDYAHHPKEIESFLKSVKNIFSNKQICGVFQPHLYSRTRDFAEEFARALELLDEVILLDIYPAREKPIEGVTSAWLLSLIRRENKHLLSKQELASYLQARKPELLVTMGAGDIDLILNKIIKNGKQ